MHISAQRKYKVTLLPKDRTTLQIVLHQGTIKARITTRARILLLADAGKTDNAICGALGLVRSVVHDIRKKYTEGGLQKALYDAPRPGKERKLTGVQEAQVVTISCTTPPDGYSHWTLDLLTEQVKKKLGVVIGRTAIWKVCLRNKLKPWREKNVGYL